MQRICFVLQIKPERLKEYKEMSAFVSTHTFRSVNLSPNRTSTGWVFFDLKNRWLGPWRKPEQFILRLSIANTKIEFPFQLPPKQGKLTLRHPHVFGYKPEHKRALKGKSLATAQEILANWETLKRLSARR